MKIRIYTDGACSGNPGPGGWGAVLLLPEDIKEISGYEERTTNNRMELIAVVQALRTIYKMGFRKIDLYTDSAYVVNAVNKGWLKKWERNGWKTTSKEDVKNKDLWIKLMVILKKECKINVIKIKGHSGHKHNERADVIAKGEITKNR